LIPWREDLEKEYEKGDGAENEAEEAAGAESVTYYMGTGCCVSRGLGAFEDLR
jgi:hypothetical protein